jgi:cholesterol transport system auxiliary component
VLASAEFDETEAAPSDDPYGGVLAANRALGRLLERLAAFCAVAPTAR